VPAGHGPSAICQGLRLHRIMHASVLRGRGHGQGGGLQWLQWLIAVPDVQSTTMFTLILGHATTSCSTKRVPNCDSSVSTPKVVPAWQARPSRHRGCDSEPRFNPGGPKLFNSLKSTVSDSIMPENGVKFPGRGPQPQATVCATKTESCQHLFVAQTPWLAVARLLCHSWLAQRAAAAAAAAKALHTGLCCFQWARWQGPLQ